MGRLSCVPDLLVRVVRVDLEDARGQPVETLQAGQRIRLKAALEARAELRDARIRFDVTNNEGTTLFSVRHSTSGGPVTVPVDHHAVLDVEVENPLAPGHYGLLFGWSCLEPPANTHSRW